MQAQLAVERPSDTVRPVWRARDEGAGGLISPSGSGGLMPGTASPAPQLRLKLVALADFSQHTMPGVSWLSLKRDGKSHGDSRARRKQAGGPAGASES